MGGGGGAINLDIHLCVCVGGGGGGGEGGCKSFITEQTPSIQESLTTERQN